MNWRELRKIFKLKLKERKMRSTPIFEEKKIFFSFPFEYNQTTPKCNLWPGFSHFSFCYFSLFVLLISTGILLIIIQNPSTLIFNHAVSQFSLGFINQIYSWHPNYRMQFFSLSSWFNIVWLYKFWLRSSYNMKLVKWKI